MEAVDARPRIRRVIRFSRAKAERERIIVSAIRNLRPIEFFYHGGYRTVEPFALGIVLTDHEDNESLLCWQTGGFSDLLEVVGWKLYRVSDMEDLEVSKEHFTGDRPGYDPSKLEMVRLIEYVKPHLHPEEPVTVPEPAPELKIETAPIPVPEPAPVCEPAPEVEAPVIRFLTHNELMERFRYAHPQPIPDLDTTIWPEPLAIPFPEPFEPAAWPVPSARHLLGQTA